MNQRRNKYKILKWILIVTIAFCTLAYPQSDIPIGTWRNHFAHNRAIIVHQVENRIFCVTEIGLFIYNPVDNSIQLLSKIDGLNNNSVSAINYQSETESVVLGYTDGNIDILEGQEILNVPDIMNSDLSYSKKILDIEFYRPFIYFITEFGVVVYNQDQGAIKETWQNLSEEGEFLKVIKGAISDDTIFLATELGVIAGDLRPEYNLMDYRNWDRFNTDQGLPQAVSHEIESFDRDVYVVQNDSLIYSYNNGYWSRSFEQITGSIISMKTNDNTMTITQSNGVYFMAGGQPMQEVTDGLFLSVETAIIIDQDMYVADFINGLIHKRSTVSEVIRPSGPFSNDMYRLHDFEGNILAVPRGFDKQYQPLRNTSGFYYFHDGLWHNFNNSGGYGYVSIPDVKDLVDISYNSVTGKVYFASYGYGLMEWDTSDGFQVYDDETSGVTLVNSNPPGPYVLIPAVDGDQSGNTWMANYETNLPLHEFESPDSWSGYSISTSGSAYIKDLVITMDNYKWMTVNPSFGGGIIVYDEETGMTRRLTSQEGNGGLPANSVHSMVEDMEGQIWIGTDNGVAYFPFPFLVFEDADFESIRPIYEGNYLFNNETITSLEIDGGNRKWIGTEKGAWLFGPDCTELVIQFDLENSPILSEIIMDIEVNQVSGEVFFGTDKGLISYRGDAIAPEETHNRVKIFPNPVTPNFNGIVGIEGLPFNSIIKITDISGNLVYQTRSQGGMATWNVLDLNGQRPNTGVYLVFSSTDDGSDTYVGKLAIIK
jgi:hypothetical protein